MKLLIAIPALNEEDSIESIIQRSLDARQYIISNSPVDQVDITVVSDGSTDQTVELARKYADRIRLIVFPQNQGYGAAIKEAWRQSDAGILGFLDADGTCDPRFFAVLCTSLESERADVALGCRLNPNSHMPAVRRLGNRIFGAALSIFAASTVRDTASGMRVVRRSSLGKLLPLPDGLHFTPAMSARAMLSDSLTITEIDMPYHERTGQSKLRALKDGFRFLRVILEAAFLYRPSRPLTLAALVFFAGAGALMLQPIVHYFQTRSVAEWMIYRFLVSSLLGTTACLAFCASYVSDRVVSMALAEEVSRSRRKSFFRGKIFWLVLFALVSTGTALVLASALDLLSRGATYEHWSRFVVMSFCFSVAVILCVTRVIDYVLDLISDRMRYLKSVAAEGTARQTSAASGAMRAAN
jgi:glycosyltransferase involved in cell wall biosynthesis